MNNYVNRFGTANQNRGRKKLLISALAVVAVFLIVIMFVGIVAGSQTERSQSISAAIAENTTLKQQVESQRLQIEELTAEIEALRAKLPPEEFVPYQPQEEQETEILQEESNEENYPSSPRDEIYSEGIGQ